ncbi:MAG: phosphatidylserine/phosphatidylglycerophosphate/cardiolipin synthase family protein [Cryobacterium sp.]|nr:phosphatidylserine/phosphatidylglycerophosphate/cardiolipin synthase family protein [Oligoflexia bacterium]
MRIYLNVISIFFMLVASSQAEIYPSRGNTEVIYLGDMNVDFEVRMMLFRQARKSIDILSMSQTADEIGLPILKSIRSAQINHGVKVRIAYDQMISMMEGDLTNTSARIISDPSLPCPGEVICTGTIEKWLSGLDYNDLQHQKVTVIDAGTPSEVIIVGGRGYTDFNKDAADSALLIRRIKPGIPYIGDDIIDNLERTWDFLNSISKPMHFEKPYKDNSRVLKTRGKRLAEKSKDRVDVLEIMSVLRRPAAEMAGKSLKGFQFHPEESQFLTNNLLENLNQSKKDHSFKNRAELPNDNHSRIISDIEQFNGKVELSAYALGMTEDLRTALVNFVNRGNTLEFYTNGQESHKLLMMNGLPVFYTVEELKKIYDLTRGGRGKVITYLLDAGKAKKLGENPFLHRKQVLLKNQSTHIAYTGSDNFTWSAAKKNDESLARFDDRRMVKAFSQVTASEIGAYTKISEAEVNEMYHNRPLLYRCARSLIRASY